MLKEAITEISRLAQEAKSAGSLVRMLPELYTTGTLAYVGADGVIHHEDREQQDWQVTPASLDQLPAVIALHPAANVRGLIVYNDCAVQFLADRDNTAAFSTCVALRSSPAREWLVRQKTNEGLTVQELRHALIWTLSDCLPDEDRRSILSHLKKSKWQTTTTSHADTSQRGRASLGREITGAIEGTILDLPDQITLSVAPFTDRALKIRGNVRCDIELLVQAERIQVIPDQRDLGDLHERAMDEIAALLTSQASGVPVIYGRANCPDEE